MKRGNVLVLGNSGVGKSTLINAVLGEDVAPTGYGSAGTTKELKIFENDKINFRLIDSVGFEPGFLKRRSAVNAVRDWSKIAAKAGDPNSQINVIWFCVDGTSRKLFPQTIDSLARSVSVFKTVPIIVVITKSYSEPDREENIRMVRQAFAKRHRKLNVERIIPVVAEIYYLNEQAFAAPEGISELIDATNDVMPSGIAAAEYDISQYKLQRKNTFAHGVIGASTAAGVATAAVTFIPMTDAVVLSGIEAAEVNLLAQIYGVKKGNKAHALIEHIVELGTVSAVARAACTAITKAVPIAGSVINMIVAGSFVGAIGEGTRYIFEQIYLGNKSIEDIEWVEKVLDEKLTGGFIDKVKQVSATLNDDSTKEDVIKAVKAVFVKDEEGAE